mgnify:CR=1 FL=1
MLTINVLGKRYKTVSFPHLIGWNTRRKSKRNELLHERLVNILGALIGAGIVFSFLPGFYQLWK